MIEFFRDFLDGPIYFVVAGISIVLIMAIIGFLMERKKLEKEEKDKRVTINVAPIEPVEVREQVITNEQETNVQTIPNPVDNPKIELNTSEMAQPVDSKENQKESAPQPAVQVIDFGSTDSVDIEN